MRRALVVWFVAVLLGVWPAQVGAQVGEAVKLPWSQRVPKEHPRLFITKEEIPNLKARFEAPVHKAYYAELIREVRRAAEGKLVSGHMVNAATLYLVTGEKLYADYGVWLLEGWLAGKVPVKPIHLHDVAFAYDWLYDELSEEQRKKIAAQLVSGDLETPPTLGRTFYDHTSKISAVIAAYGAPGVDSAALEKVLSYWDAGIRKVMVPTLVARDGTWGDSMWYQTEPGHRFWMPIFFKIWSAVDDRILDDMRPHLGNYVRWAVFADQPHTGAGPWIGKCGFAARSADGLPALIASAYRDPVAQWRYHQHRGAGGPHRDWMMLFYDPSLEEKPPSFYGHPGAIFGADQAQGAPGYIIMKSDWTPGATYLFFTCGHLSGSHRMWNHFVISRKGFLLNDDGFRDGSENTVMWPYYCSAWAHNTVTIITPQGEREQTGPWDAYYPGRIVAWGANSDYDYVAGDATATYDPKVLTSFVRQIVFLRPKTFLVFDRVSPTRADSKVQCIFHVNRPELVSGREVGSHRWEEGLTEHTPGAVLAAGEGGGKFFYQNLFPAEAVTRTRGGLEMGKVAPGKDNVGTGTVRDIKIFPRSLGEEWHLTCVSTEEGGRFSVWGTRSSIGESPFTGRTELATVGQEFTGCYQGSGDNRNVRAPCIAFTIQPGDKPFAIGDRFTFEVRDFRFWVDGPRHPVMEAGEVIAGDANVGDGEVTDIRLFVETPGEEETWTLTCIDPKDGGLFRVQGSLGVPVRTNWGARYHASGQWDPEEDKKPVVAVVGQPFLGYRELAISPGDYRLQKGGYTSFRLPCIAFTVKPGARPFAIGDSFTFKVRPSGQWRSGYNHTPEPRVGQMFVWQYARSGLTNVQHVGGWRIETVCPARQAPAGILHLLYAGDREEKEMPHAEAIVASGRSGAKVTVEGKAYEVTFNSVGKVGGHIKVTEGGKVIVDRELVDHVEKSGKD